MDNLNGDISRMIFKRVEIEDTSEISLDSKMLKVITELDGKKDVAGVARKLDMDLGTIKSIVGKLLELKLIRVSEEALALLDNDFLEYLTRQLFEATGPIAGALIEDVADELGTSVREMPLYRAAEFVDQLSREIPDEGKKLAFKQAMLKKLSEKGY
jgi:hypothetical protein